MWFEIIPAVALVVVGIGGPGLALYWTHYLVLGNVSTSVGTEYKSR